jgi:hypothetical protein
LESAEEIATPLLAIEIGLGDGVAGADEEFGSDEGFGEGEAQKF